VVNVHLPNPTNNNTHAPFGFVELSNLEELQLLVATARSNGGNLDFTPIPGRTIRVDVANSRQAIDFANRGKPNATRSTGGGRGGQRPR
jgi:hypothetical protein